MPTSIDVAAWVAGVVLLKGSVICLAVIGIARCARSASGASFAMGTGFGVLGLVLGGPVLPSLGSGFVSIPHDAIQPISIGSQAVSLVGILIALWASGVVLGLGRVIRDLISARNLAQRAEGQKGERVDEQLLRAAHVIGVPRIPDLRWTTELSTAALIGLRRPVLLLPVQAREWSDDELFGVLCHELEHLRRNDWLMFMVERVVRAVFWINPLVHVLTRQAAIARERAADDAAMRAGAGAAAYATRLISVARELRTMPRMAASVAFASSGVEQRVRALFDSRDRRPLSRSTTLGAIVVALPLMVGLAAVQPFVCLPGAAQTTEGCP